MGTSGFHHTQSYIKMSEVYEIEGYQFVLHKRSDTSLAINAHTETGKSIFESGPIDLKKVKFETVQAALARTNSKNIIGKF